MDDVLLIADICHHLEGMPLAIELAASWARTLPLRDVNNELQRGLDFLSTSIRDMPTRHQSMHAVFEHSWQLLEPNERSILRQMSVFRGGCTREAAEAVTGASLAHLSALVDGSWLRLRETGRYHLHELVRQFCEHRLISEHDSQTGEDVASVRRRHCDYYAALMSSSPSNPDQQIPLLQTSVGEFENLSITLEWAAENLYLSSFAALMSGLWYISESMGTDQALITPYRKASSRLEHHLSSASISSDQKQQLIETLIRITRTQAVISTRYRWLEEARIQISHLDTLIDLVESPEHAFYWRSWVLRVGCQLALREGDSPTALRTGLKALAMYEDDKFTSLRFIHRNQDRHIGQIYHQADILAAVAHANWYLGNYSEAEEQWLRSIRLGEVIGEQLQRAQHFGQLARMLITTGDYNRAETFAREAYQVANSIIDYEWAAIAEQWIGFSLHYLGNNRKARRHTLRAMAAWKRSHYHRLSVSGTVLGLIELAEGNNENALATFESTIEEISIYDSPRSSYLTANYLGMGWVNLVSRSLEDAEHWFLSPLLSGNATSWEKMESIMGLAEVAAHRGAFERAVELHAFVSSHPFTAHIQRQKSIQSLDALGAKLPPSRCAALIRSGRSMNLDATLTHILSAESSPVSM